MSILAAALPACDLLDRLEQQRSIEPDDHLPAQLVEVNGCGEADLFDLIDQATPTPLPDDEDYPARPDPDQHDIP
ncbi:MAG: hypothetical protein HOQ24_15225 [Mycobacteriaceae bacterium]|nr:hypothetical protein [Mycobacteriaceae bacterium]